MRRLRMTIRQGMIVIALTALVTDGAISIAGARDAALRAHCANNLKQIGLAIHNYENSFDSFPTGTVGNRALPPERRLGWTVLMFGFLTQGLGLIVDDMQAWDSPANLRPLFRHSSTDGDPPPYTTSAMNCYDSLQCPAHPVRASSGVPAPTGYVGIAGLGPDAAALPLGQSRAGVFGYERVTRIADITDGAATTMLLAETTSARGPWTAGGPATVRGLDPSRQPYMGSGRQFGGAHRDGTMVALADGSVRFLRDSIDPDVFAALSTVAGGERLPTDWER